MVTSGQFDLVIADLSIPISSGKTVPRLLKRLRSEIKVVILSVHDELAAAQECLAARAQGFVLTQAAANDLIPAVEAVLRGEIYVSPCIQIRQEEGRRADSIN